MIGTGLTFAVGIGGLVSVIGLIAILRGRASVFEVMGTAGRFGVASFILGTAFAGLLAIVARTRFFHRLSLRFATGLGAAVGLLYWTMLAITGAWSKWTPGLALWNFVLLVGIGSGAAAATILVARKTGALLAREDEPASLGAGEPMRYSSPDDGSGSRAATPAASREGPDGRRLP
jgi:hypothetical protein